MVGKQLHIGILAMQGCVAPHVPHLKALGCAVSDVRHAADLDDIDGIILPGGESSAMLRLLEAYGLEQALLTFMQTKSTWGICAGAILMAKTVTNPTQKSFGVLDMDVKRNAYGRQLDSFHGRVDDYPVAFIRAPVITRTGDGVIVKAALDGHPVWVEQGQVMATTFHPELSNDLPSPMHRRFTDIIDYNAKTVAAGMAKLRLSNLK